MLLTCLMDLRLFPFDKQECKAIFAYAEFVNNAIDPLMWKEGYAEYANLTLTEYTIEDITVIKRNWSVSLDWPVLELTFHLQRDISPYITQYFLPTLILTALSWASFWIPPNIYPARIALVLTNFLALCVIQRGMKHELPMTSYMTALEIYVVGNMAFIVIIMIQYILVLLYEDSKKRKNQEKKTKPNNAMQESEIGLNNMEESTGQISEAIKSTGDKLSQEIPSLSVQDGQPPAYSIDKISRIILPVSCLVFNATFFAYYW